MITFPDVDVAEGTARDVFPFPVDLRAELRRLLAPFLTDGTDTEIVSVVDWLTRIQDGEARSLKHRGKRASAAHSENLVTLCWRSR